LKGKKKKKVEVSSLDIDEVNRVKIIKHYALENPFTDRSFKGLKKLYPFSSKNYINTSIDDVSKMECFTKPKIIKQEKLALPIAKFLHSVIYTLIQNHQKKGNLMTKTFKLKLYD
jgi:hypothetical protein